MRSLGLFPFVAAAILAAWLFHATFFVSRYEGTVVKVIDGDTIEVMHDGKAERVRLGQIDAPERGQPFGKVAKQFVLDMAVQKIVIVDVETVDRYGRTVGEVLLPDGGNLNKNIVAAGYAWHYEQYSDDDEYKELEMKAREARRGLWRDESPVAPWEWRKGKR